MLVFTIDVFWAHLCRLAGRSIGKNCYRSYFMFHISTDLQSATSVYYNEFNGLPNYWRFHLPKRRHWLWVNIF